jgi:hypothetical protein
MDLTLKLVIVIGSLLTLFECSRPKKTSVRRWTAALVAGLKRIRQPNDLRRAAISMYLIDKRVKNVVPGATRMLFSPFKGEGVIAKVITTALGLTGFMIPLLILVTPPTGMIWMTYLQIAGVGGMAALVATIMVMAIGESDDNVFPDDQGYANDVAPAI